MRDPLDALPPSARKLMSPAVADYWRANYWRVARDRFHGPSLYASLALMWLDEIKRATEASHD